MIKFASLDDVDENHVVFEGLVYDLTGFNHPGGDDVNLFGGCDVTVAYRMIHAFHDSSGSRLKKSLKLIGKIEGKPTIKGNMEQKVTAFDAKETRLKTKTTGMRQHERYKFGTEFEKEIREQIRRLIPNPKNRFGTLGWWARAVLYISLYFALLTHWIVNGSSFVTGMALGVAMALIGLNVQHDANHGAASQYPWVNAFLGGFADLIGGCRMLWLQQHWTHHSFTNDISFDPDASSSEPLFLFHNYHALESEGAASPRRWWHAAQHYFWLAVLSMYALSTTYLSTDAYLAHHSSANWPRYNWWIRSGRLQSTVLRLAFLYAILFRPCMLGWQTDGLAGCMRALGHVSILAGAESLALAIPFAVSHNFEASQREPCAVGRNACWATTQVETACTYGGVVAGWVTGGLNFQIEHHLFPRVCSAWYPAMRPIVQRVCKKHGVRYAYFPNFVSNLISANNYIKNAGSAGPPLITKNVT